MINVVPREALAKDKSLCQVLGNIPSRTVKWHKLLRNDKPQTRRQATSVCGLWFSYKTLCGSSGAVVPDNNCAHTLMEGKTYLQKIVFLFSPPNPSDLLEQNRRRIVREWLQSSAHKRCDPKVVMG